METIAETLNTNNQESIIEENKIANDNKEQLATTVAKGTERIKNTAQNANNSVHEKTQQVKSQKATIAMAGTNDNVSQISEEKPNNIIAKQEELVTKEMTKVVAQKELIASIIPAENTRGKVTKEDIDALLSNAQNDIQKQQALKIKNSKVDAMALLNNIEMEQQRSLRNRVFYALGDGLEYVKENVVGIGN